MKMLNNGKYLNEIFGVTVILTYKKGLNIVRSIPSF